MSSSKAERYLLRRKRRFAEFHGRNPNSEELNRLAPPSVKKQKVNQKRNPSKAFLSASPFDDLAISDESKRALRRVLKYQEMTRVQHLTIPLSLSGMDVLARAKTGTGKTLAFLIPTVERIIKMSEAADHNYGILAICISPTRELAAQITAECKALTTFHEVFNTQCIFGGTDFSEDFEIFKKRIDLLVATPGRLLRHLLSTKSVNVLNLTTLILDEADQLLEMGFHEEISRIIKLLPANRQSLLFSATVPDSVKEMTEIVLRKDYKFVDCVRKTQTVREADQYHLTVNDENFLQVICGLLHEARVDYPDDYKVLVFFVTARLTSCMAKTINAVEPGGGTPKFKVLEIHSLKNQGARTNISQKFRKCKRGIMFSSDVSARGLDYPNITHVIQVGRPASKEQYVHRIGRTARAGHKGKCVLVLPPRCRFLKYFQDLPVRPYPNKMPRCPGVPRWIVNQAMDSVDIRVRKKSYMACMGYYTTHLDRKGTKAFAVEQMNHFAKIVLRLEEIPRIKAKTVELMGLGDVSGVPIQQNDDDDDFGYEIQTRRSRKLKKKSKTKQDSKTLTKQYLARSYQRENRSNEFGC